MQVWLGHQKESALALPKQGGLAQQRAIEVDELVIQINRQIQDDHYALGTALMEVEQHQYWLELGFPSFREYLLERAGRHYRWYQYLKRYVEQSDAFPQLREAVTEGKIRPVIARTVASMLQPENIGSAIQRLSGKTFREAMPIVKDILSEQKPVLRPTEGTTWHEVSGHLDKETFDHWLQVMAMAERIVGSEAFHLKIKALLMAAHAEFVSTYPEWFGEEDATRPITAIWRGDEKAGADRVGEG